MNIVKKAFRKLFYPLVKKKRMKGLTKYGEKVTVGDHCRFLGHIECGDNVYINEGAYFVSTKAKLIIGSHCVFGPNVTIYTGDHAIRVIGKHIIDVTDEDKDQLGGDYDKDVVIEEGCWIGTRAIILKGVTVGRGSVVGAGAVVTKSIPPYSVYVGVPSAKVFPRFTEEEITQHEQKLKAT